MSTIVFITAAKRVRQLYECLVASAYLAAAQLRLSSHGLSAAQGANRRAYRPRKLPAASVDQISHHWWRAIERAARIMPGATCLVRALALQRYLSANGIATQLCYGVKRDACRLRAHAWLERQGTCVGEAPGAVAGFSKLSHPLVNR